MNIVLIGYRGTGKSVVGRLLAARLGMKYVGLDAAIVERAGISIPKIVEKYGWPGFRDRESAEVRAVASGDNLVIDTGGGVIERPENMELLRQTGCVIWLKAKVDTIASRIHEDTNRPSLTSGKSFIEEISEVLERRSPVYRDSARHEIDTDALTTTEIVEKIISLCKSSL